MALKLRQDSGNIYLHTQFYAGSIYIAASICVLVLRAWKIEEIEQIAVEEEDVAKARNQSSTERENPITLRPALLDGLFNGRKFRNIACQLALLGWDIN